MHVLDQGGGETVVLLGDPGEVRRAVPEHIVLLAVGEGEEPLPPLRRGLAGQHGEGAPEGKSARLRARDTGGG